MAMNASATPFVPAVDTDKPEPAEGAAGGGDAAGAQRSAAGGGAAEASKPAAEEGETGGMSGTALWRPQYMGRIRSFSEQRGYGFVDCQETLRAFGCDVFIHRHQLAEAGVWIGQEVLFEVELNKTGQPQARNVQAINIGDYGTWDMVNDPNGMKFANGYMPPFASSMSKGSNFGMPGYNIYGSGQDSAFGGAGGAAGDVHGAPEPIEEMLRKCSGSSDVWEIIEKYGQHFGKIHVVTALYQLGLCRQYERRTSNVSLTPALVDRLMQISPAELTADEASRVLWALAILEEVRGHTSAHRFAVELGEEATRRHHEFSPSQMVSFVSSLSRLVRAPEEDELVAKITTNFSEHALGNGLPRFPPDELRIWTRFLETVSSPHSALPQPTAAYPYGMPPPRAGGGGMGFPGGGGLYGPQGGGGYGMGPPGGCAGASGMGPPSMGWSGHGSGGKGMFPGMQSMGSGGKGMPSGPGMPPPGYGGWGKGAGGFAPQNPGCGKGYVPGGFGGGGGGNRGAGPDYGRYAPPGPGYSPLGGPPGPGYSPSGGGADPFAMGASRGDSHGRGAGGGDPGGRQGPPAGLPLAPSGRSQGGAAGPPNKGDR